MLKLIAAVVVVVALAVATYALAGGDDAKRGDPAKVEQKKRARDAREGHGPPPWAPAYGRRCKDAGNTPGSQAFKDCIKASKR